MSVMYDNYLVATIPSPSLVDEDGVQEACEAAFYEGVLEPLSVTVMQGGRRVIAFGDTGEAMEASDALRDTLLAAGATRVTWVLVSDEGADARVSLPDGSFFGDVSDLDEILDSEEPAEALDALWEDGAVQLEREP